MLPAAVPAQTREAPLTPTVAANDWRVTLTIFRSPGTGIQISKGRLAAFVAHYPTVFERDGEQRGTQFIRTGVAMYGSADARTTPYVSLSVASSLTAGWSNSGLLDVGVRRNLGDRYSGQLGAAVLYAPHTKRTRVNPTVGMGVRF